tara:strand:- start:1 stop:309 length:309 start_codon:yes stop_codon:yes gene_type:complete
MITQENCYKALLEGKTLYSKEYEASVLIKSGVQFVKYDNGRTDDRGKFVFQDPSEWSIKKEPKKAYAYKHTSGQLVFYPKLQDKASILNLPFSRASEYDISI